MTLLAGRYETVRAIAAGGMATVHLAKAVGLGGFERLVAVKVMHPHLSLDPDFVAMFLDEARLAAGIRHPNVVATIDVQQADEGLFLVMEYIEGCSLRVLLRALAEKRRRLPIEIALKVFGEALAGLHAAHELRDTKGVPLRLVHRDVSPANILVGTDGVTRLTDFGVARAESRISSTRGGQLKGKIPYMPPEQIMGEDVDRRVDIYATGLVLWEALVGRRAFHAPNEGALLHTILTGAKQSPRELRRDVPEPVDRACMKALALKPDDRYATAAEFADALEQAAADANVRVASARAVSALVTEITAALGPTPVGEGAGAPVPDWSGSWEASAADGADGGDRDGTALTAATASSSAIRPPGALGSGVHRPAADGMPSHSQSTGVSAALSAVGPLQAPVPARRRRTIAIGAAAAVVVGVAVGVTARMSGGGEGAAAAPSEQPAEPASASSLAATGAPPPSTAPPTDGADAATATAPSATSSTVATGRPGTRPTKTSTKTGTPKATSAPATTAAPTSLTGYRPTQL